MLVHEFKATGGIPTFSDRVTQFFAKFLQTFNEAQTSQLPTPMIKGNVLHIKLIETEYYDLNYY